MVLGLCLDMEWLMLPIICRVGMGGERLSQHAVKSTKHKMTWQCFTCLPANQTLADQQSHHAVFVSGCLLLAVINNNSVVIIIGKKSQEAVWLSLGVSMNSEVIKFNSLLSQLSNALVSMFIRLPLTTHIHMYMKAFHDCQKFLSLNKYRDWE